MLTDEEFKKLNDELQRAKRNRNRPVYETHAIDQKPWIMPPLTDEELAVAMDYMNKTEEPTE